MAGNGPLVSVVVPVRSDTEALVRLLADIRTSPDIEIVVSAVHGDEDALATVQADRPDIVWVWGPPGRGVQLNAGAAHASGRWLWFVHADSTIPPGWLEEFARLEEDVETVGGSFAFALTSAAWQARVIEQAVRWRVRLFGLAYGDQGLFVRREVFEAIGGFAPWPLMEDVEFVRRLNRHGGIAHLNRALSTSARRWEREGWWRRSGRNLAHIGALRPRSVARSAGSTL